MLPAHYWQPVKMGESAHQSNAQKCSRSLNLTAAEIWYLRHLVGFSDPNIPF